MVRRNFREFLENAPRDQTEINSKPSPLGLNIAFSIAIELAGNHFEGSMKKIQPPSIDECHKYLHKNIDSWMVACTR